LLALLTQLLRGIEHMQAGSAAHGTMGGTQLREVHAKAGAAMGALGDEALGHAAIRPAPWAAPSCVRFTRKLVRQWGHWVTKLWVMRRSG